MKKLLRFEKSFLLFLFGGVGYTLIEYLFRGYSHPSMFLLGGICFLAIGSINEVIPWCMPLVSQMMISSLLVTVLEFIFGIVLNVWLKIGVWNYSDLPYNLCGQICLLFSVFWFFLSLLAIFIDDYLRYKLFDEEFPRYCVFYCNKHSKLFKR